MQQGGWIKVYRSLESWEWWGDAEMVKAFLAILFRCEPNSYKWRGIEMDAGSFVTTQERLCEILKKTRQQVRTIISRLVQSGEIVVKSDNHHTVISVVNWAQYQENNQPITNRNGKINQPQIIEEQGLNLDFSGSDNQPITNRNGKINQPITNREKKEESTKEEIKNNKNQESLNYPSMTETDLLGNPVEESKSESVLPFEVFWMMYQKKTDKKACEKAYARIPERERIKIKQHLPRYVESTPEVRYRKNPLTYLHRECWNDEIVTQQEPQSTENRGPILQEYKFKADESGTEKLPWDDDYK